VFLTGAAYRSAAGALSPGRVGKKIRFDLPGVNAISSYPHLLDRLAGFSRSFNDELKRYCDGIALIPQLEFDIDILNNRDIDSFYLALFQRELMPQEVLEKIRCSFAEQLYPQIIEPFIIFDEEVAFSLQEDRPATCIKTIWTNPEFFALSKSCKTNDFNDILRCTGIPSPSCVLPLALLKETIDKRVDKIEAILSDRSVLRMKTLEFLRFFWAALRTRLLAACLDSREMIIPLTSSQILKAAQEYSPDDAGWLSTLYKEYNKELTGRESEAFRHIAEALGFIKRIM
jgi:hypothetical protein